MSLRTYLPLAIAIGVIAASAVAQPTPPANPPTDRDRAMMDQDARMHDRMHDDRSGRDHMSMRHHDSDWRTMRWCRSMSYRRMMRNPRCRWLMHRHSDRM